MFSENIEDLRPVPTFPRAVDTPQSDFSLGQRLYKPSQYHLTIEKKVLSFNKDPLPSR